MAFVYLVLLFVCSAVARSPIGKPEGSDNSDNSDSSDSSEVCPPLACNLMYIIPECRQENYMTAPDGKTQCRLCDTVKDNCEPVEFPTLPDEGSDNSDNSDSSDSSEVCPPLACNLMYIIPECRQENYMTAPDGKTQCRLCDTVKDNCEPVEFPTLPDEGSDNSDNSDSSEVCPPLACNLMYIIPECRQENYMTAPDGKTQCRLCDTVKDNCEPVEFPTLPDEVVCPQLECPNDDILYECRKPQFVIGLDGKTPCRICDTSFCGPKQQVCPAIYCPDFHQIPPRCREEQNIIGIDGITVCQVCPRNRCVNRSG